MRPGCLLGLSLARFRWRLLGQRFFVMRPVGGVGWGGGGPGLGVGRFDYEPLRSPEGILLYVMHLPLFGVVTFSWV